MGQAERNSSRMCSTTQEARDLLSAAALPFRPIGGADHSPLVKSNGQIVARLHTTAVVKASTSSEPPPPLHITIRELDQ